jgi:hypothetical protein
VAIVATSSLKALEDAIDMVRKGGTVMMFGVPSKDSKIRFRHEYNLFQKKLLL